MPTEFGSSEDEVGQEDGPSRPYQSNRKLATIANCPICGKLCRYIYYTVQCCEGCKQFFRRTIVAKKMWDCPKENNCKIPSVGNQCKSCRLNRCLAVGMDWKTMALPFMAHLDPFFDQLEAKRQELVRKDVLNKNDKFELDRLLHVVRAQSRIRHAFSDFQDWFVGAHGTMEEMLLSGDNLLGLAEHFTAEPRHFTGEKLAKIKLEIDQFGAWHQRALKSFVVDRLVCIGLAKSMLASTFGQIDLKDQILLLKHMAVPITLFCRSFCAFELGAETWALKDGGIYAMAYYQSEKYGGDKHLLSLANAVFTKPVEHLFQANITPEEFGLLLPLLFTQTIITAELSVHAQELLYAESQHYSQMLLRHVQTRHGTFPGAHRFSECVELINQTFYTAKKHGMLITYLEAFHERKGLETEFPHFLRAIM